MFIKKRLMRNLYLGLAIIFSSIQLSAQETSFEWVKTGEGTDQGDIYSMVTDENGNIYSTGFFRDTVDFDPDTSVFYLTDNGSNDIFVQKLDVNGNLVWAKSFGGNYSDVAFSIATDSEGSVYTTGYFTDSVDFDPGLGVFYLASDNANDKNIFIHKLDSLGNFVWARSMGSIQDDRGKSIAIDLNDNVYTTGYFQGPFDIDPSYGNEILLPHGDKDIFIHKMNSDGELIWGINIGSPMGDEGVDIKTDADGNVYVACDFRGTIDFDPNTSVYNLTANGNPGNFDIGILKLDSASNFQWAKSMGQGTWDRSRSMAIDNFGNVILTGYFSYTVDFDPDTSAVYNLTSNGSFDIFIQKLDTDGDFQWAKNIGGNYGDMADGITTDMFGDVYLTGDFNGIIDFDPSADVFELESSLNSRDIFIEKFDSDGNFVWVKKYGGPGGVFTSSIAIDNNTDILTAGNYFGEIDFDPDTSSFNLSPYAGADFFIHKMEGCRPFISVDTISTCGPFTWIDGVTYYEDNSTAFYCYDTTGVGGCDSVNVLNLSIDPLGVIVTLDTYTLSTTFSGQTYQWLDCDDNYTAIPGANDQSFTVISNGSYALEVTDNGCIDTSFCTIISNIGLAENDQFKGVHIYPNPNAGLVNIDLGELKDVSINVYDILGQLIYQKENINSDYFQFELNQVRHGVYIIELGVSGETKQYKLVKN